MGNYFEIHYNAIKYPIDSEKSRGLRNAQLGAIHAISSFFTLNKKDAAIVIMPTGSGKTLLAQTLAKKLNVQFAIADATALTEAGYVGEDVENILLKIIQAADYDIDRAQC